MDDRDNSSEQDGPPSIRSQSDIGFPTVPDHSEPHAKDDLLEAIRTGLEGGVITKEDVMSLAAPASGSGAVVQSMESGTVVPKAADHKKLSAVEVMFYIGGLLLFAAVMSLVAQVWDQNNPVELIGLSAGVGYALWLIAYVLDRQKASSDIRSGTENALIVTGALSVIVGGFITMVQVIGPNAATPYFPVAVTFILLSAVFFIYDRLIHKDLIILLGEVLGVAAFPSIMAGLLATSHVPYDVWSVVSLATIVLLLNTSRVVARMQPDRPLLHRPFDGLCSFLALGTMLVSNFTNLGLLWLMLLFASILGMFYLSIIHRNKQFLGTASFYLIAGVLTVAFKYFSGAGITVSLAVSTVGILGSAAIATTINRKYFKTA